MEFCKLAGKCLASAILLGAILIIAGLMVALGPLYLALVVKGKASSALVEIIPLGVLGGLLWRLWTPAKPDDSGSYEAARELYNEGVTAGKKMASPQARIAK